MVIVCSSMFSYYLGTTPSYIIIPNNLQTLRVIN